MFTFKDSVLRHIAQNTLMSISVFRNLARQWHHMGMGRSKEKILPVLRTILDFLDQSNLKLENKVVLELGPGQTPDLLFCGLLFGAKKSIGLDIIPYLGTDILNISNFKECANWIEELDANGQLNSSWTYDAERFNGMRNIPVERFEIKSYDGISFPVKDESIDIIWTKSVLEHVKNYERIILEMNRVLKLNGVMCHIIDLRDHTTLENGKDWLRSLRFSNRVWELMLSNRTNWTNRLRSSQWKEAFRSSGFQPIIENIEILPFHKDFTKNKLVKPYRDMTEDDLRVAWLKVLYQKT